MLQLLWTTTKIGDRQYLKRIVTVNCDRKRRILHSTTFCDQEIIFLSDRATVLDEHFPKLQDHSAEKTTFHENQCHL